MGDLPAWLGKVSLSLDRKVKIIQMGKQEKDIPRVVWKGGSSSQRHRGLEKHGVRETQGIEDQMKRLAGARSRRSGMLDKEPGLQLLKIFSWLEGWFKTTVRKSTRVVIGVARTSQEMGVAGGELLLICAMCPLPPSVSLEKTSMPQEEQEEGPCHIAHRVPWGRQLRSLATQSSALILSVQLQVRVPRSQARQPDHTQHLCFWGLFQGFHTQLSP